MPKTRRNDPSEVPRSTTKSTLSVPNSDSCSEEEVFPSRSGPSCRPDPDPDSSSSDSLAEPAPGSDLPQTAHNFEISSRVRDSVPSLFRPKDPGHLVIKGRRDEINSTVLYCNSAWLERCHNVQTELLDILASEQTVEKKLEAAALHAEYTRFVLHHVKEFTVARYDTIRLSHTHGAPYALAVEEVVSEIPSDFKSGAALRVGKALRQAQLKHATRAQAQSGWGGSSAGEAPASSRGRKPRRGNGKKKE